MDFKYTPVLPKCRKLLHGADYNPEQWISTPQIWAEDMRLMQLAKCNVMTIGMFSWSALEPEEDKFNFDFLDYAMDMLAENGSYAILGTPSGARPVWMAQKYPEVLRTGADRVRNLYGGRHNHCYSSQIYREKCQNINKLLAQRYKAHPALVLWHISNEYSGECHCPLCQDAFRNFLRYKYNGDLDLLNHEWWTGFWSHRFTDWQQIESPASHGESELHGLNLDWKRFVTFQTTDFMLEEMKPLRQITPDIPITSNFMGFFHGLDYWKMARHLDIVSWDSYPDWHGKQSEVDLAARTAMSHDLNRSLKSGKPFLLMESTPSTTNWQPVSKLKKPGMHMLSSLQAIAHGSDSVQYFQWRKGRGGPEKFHGAVVDHCGHERTRVFKDVAAVGKVIEKLAPITGSRVESEAAIIYDWEIKWAVENAQGPRNVGISYDETVFSHYKVLWKYNVPTDFVSMDSKVLNYKLLIAPMAYMIRSETAKKLEEFVSSGGTLILTCHSGVVNENDLCFLGGSPGPLKNLAGIWVEEIDALYPDENNFIIWEDSTGEHRWNFKTHSLCERIHAESASVLARFCSDFYSGMPAVTRNDYGNGEVYYLAAQADDDFYCLFYAQILCEKTVKRAWNTKLPAGVSVTIRKNETNEFIFLMNFNTKAVDLTLTDDSMHDVIDGHPLIHDLTIPAFSAKVLGKKIKS